MQRLWIVVLEALLYKAALHCCLSLWTACQTLTEQHGKILLALQELLDSLHCVWESMYVYIL